LIRKDQHHLVFQQKEAEPPRPVAVSWSMPLRLIMVIFDRREMLQIQMSVEG